MAEIIGDPEELMAIVRRTAQQDALSREADAQRQIQRKEAEAATEAKRIAAEILAAAKAEAATTRQQQLAQAELAQQHKLLRARQALLDQVWTAAEEQLHTLVGQAEYDVILERLARRAAQILQPGMITLAADAQGHELLTTERLAAWSAEAGVTFVRAKAPAATWGGLIARHADGRRQVDATFATRLALARDALREQVAQQLEIV
ncbi:MAG: hypothetical protein KDE53_25370 [Caldilineaceae bacterium]|nr:hypothetical protein [Caldilineaceae bacterium]MCB0189796.1 hypothetical protein [Caldilineaceae bacterium]